MQQQKEFKGQDQKFKLLIGGTYKHYKGKEYKLLTVAFNCETDQIEYSVVYQGLYKDEKLGQNPIFTQSLKRFVELEMIDGKLQPRFKLIEK
jgi:hypothetical protein